MSEALFGDEGLRVEVPVDPPAEKVTAGEKLRRRQGARIAVGLHPLSIGGTVIRLHPDAARPQRDDGERGALRCGSCRYRTPVAGGAKDYPKCYFGYRETPVPAAAQTRFGPRVRISTPRAARSDATDCRAWWPACVDYQEAATDE